MVRNGSGNLLAEEVKEVYFHPLITDNSLHHPVDVFQLHTSLELFETQLAAIQNVLLIFDDLA